MNLSREPMQVPITFSDGNADLSEIVARAMTSARLAQSRWSRTPVVRRLQLVRKLRQLISEHAMRLAEASASARQRPALESLTAEVFPLAEACRFLERNAEKILAPKRLGRRGLPLWLAGVRSVIHREPFGVVLIIGPGNYPLLLPGVQLIQALVAGNAVLLKPGNGGTSAASALHELMVRAGFDSQLVTLLQDTSEAARTAIFARPDKVLFTGSAATGEKILAQLAPHLIPATMELSGWDAVIIRADADLDLAAKALVFGLTLNAGATCMSPKRVFVHRSLATELEGRLANVFRSSRREEAQFSSGKSESLLTSAATEHRTALLDDALARGAHFIAGGIRDEKAITSPIILAGVSPDSRLLREDIFAPVLSIVTVADDHEAVLRANDCPFALAASIFSRDESTARVIASQILAGVITINDLILPTADARLPFGGRGRSGFGVTRGAEGLLELTTPKVVTVSRARFRPAFDLSQPGDVEMFEAYLQFTHGDGPKARWTALVSLIKTISRRRTNCPKKRS
jgi:acyl-CoA reductase-like NAD-dependent aldehyde dehydrogenase